MPGFFEARGPATARESAAAGIAFRLHNDVSTPRPSIPRLNSPAYAYPCQHFTHTLTDASA